MFKKAHGYDDSVVFYFDHQDNKYIAKRGSLAWRLNNPGLISSYSSLAKEFSTIGSHKQFAIFPSLLIGKNAHSAWLRSTKYYDSPLIEIAKHYKPNNPETYLQQLCVITNLSSKTKTRLLSKDEFECLLRAIQKLAGFSKENKCELYQLPKITSRFYSRDRKIELFLAGYDNLLTQKEAVEWIETNRLDAVIVHKSSGIIYLRSRPGHHLNQIHLTEDKDGPTEAFKDAIRDVGKEQMGQCIWGYVNGLFTEPKRAQYCATLLSNHAEGQQVWSLVNDATSENIWNIKDSIKQQFKHPTHLVKTAGFFLKFLLDLSDRDASHPPIVVFAHSQGSLIVDLALTQLSPEERRRIQVFAFGGAAFIPSEKAHSNSHNYFSINDPIPKFSSHELYKFLLKTHQRKKQGLNTLQIIEECVQEDLISYHQELFNPETPLQFQKTRQSYYESEMLRNQNITILEECASNLWEHSFDLPCYQAKIKEIIKKYNRAQHGS